VTNLQPRYSPDEFARRGQEIYDRTVGPHAKPEDDGHFVAIDIESGEFEIDEDDYDATERLLSRKPDAQIWMMRVGQEAAYQIGGWTTGTQPQ
jgi:hypothetical protein